MPIKDGFRSPSGKLPVANARVNNLPNVSVDIAIGVLTVVTGVVGSGKSSLIHHAFLRQHRDAVDKKLSKFSEKEMELLLYSKPVAPYITMAPCTVCKGARLSQEVLKCKIDGYNIAELASMEVGQLIWVKAETIRHFNFPAR